ncbi:MAG: CotH kinase family protein, partial [Planctomycetota bacterium]
DDPEELDKWELPSVDVNAGESILVFASGKDRNVGELHADFQLSRHGESVFLVQPDGVTIESAVSAFPYLPENVSFGRDSSGTSLGFFADPTPGAANTALTLETGVVVTEIAHFPETPAAGEDVIVTAKVDLSQGLPTAVNLRYRVGFGNEFTVVMQDFGSGDDAQAGDGIYTATISSLAFDAGEMVRWSVTTSNGSGVETRNPLWDTSVIDRSNAPEYFGTMIVADNVDSNLPVLQWFLQPGQESAARSRSGTRTSVFYAGELYDNVFVRVRGGSTAGLPKNSFKFDFNQGYHFQFDERYGRVSEINLNTTFPDKAYIRQNLAFEVYNSVGAAGSVAFPMRVQRNGEFFSVAMFIEQPDDDLLLREGLDPNGALYKMFNGFTSATSNVEKKTRQFESNGDLAAFIDGMDASGASLRNFAFDHVDMPAVINYLVATVLTQNNDQQRKNYFLYRDTNGTGEWTMLPWDLDLTFGRHYMTRDNILDDELWADEDNVLGGRSNNVPISPSHPYAGEQEHPGNRSWNRLIDKLYEIPEFREMFLRRLRTAMDELLLPPGTPSEQLVLDNRIDELVAQIGGDATLDFDEWADPWSYGDNLTIQQAAERLKDEYLAIRREHLYVTHNVDNFGQPEIVGIPHAQTAQAAANIMFGDVEFDPDSGNQDEEYIQLANTGADAVDISGWR